MKNQIKILSVSLILIIAGSLGILMASEIAGYFATVMGKSTAAAWAWALCLGLMVPMAVAFWPGPSLTKWGYIAVLVACQIYAAGHQASAPVRAGDAAMIAGYQAQLTAIDGAIRNFDSPKTRTRHAELIASRSSILDRMAEAKRAEKSAIDMATAAQVFAVRALTEAGQIILVWLAVLQIRGMRLDVNEICFVKSPNLANRQELPSVRQESKIIDAIQGRGGAVTRQALLSSKILDGADEYDKELDRLISAGQITVSRNGSGKGGWIYTVQA
jgi:hypothetical protein